VSRRLRGLSLRTKVAAACLVCVLVALAGTALVYRSLGVSAAAGARVAYVNQIIEAANQAMKAVVDAETAERGYLLSGNRGFLQTYTEGTEAVDAALGDLRRLTLVPQQRTRNDQIQTLFTRWKAEVAAPEIAARREAPPGLAQAAQRGYVLVLQMRETAGAYAAGRDPRLFTQWIAEASDLRNRLETLTVMEQSSTQVAALGRAYALADQGARFGPETPAAKLVEIGVQLDPIVSAIRTDAMGADERLRRLTGADSGQAIVDQIRAVNLAFVDTAQATLRANLVATQRTARDARIVATAVPLALVLLLIAAMVAATGVTASIHEVAEAAAALAGGDFSRRVRAGGTDELGAMARAYNAMADRMRAQSQEGSLLGQMSDLLQASLSIDEACGVIARTVPRLFPGCGGSIYLVSPSRDLLESAVSWGGGGGGGATAFALEDCWALRRGQPHYFGHDSTDARCRHLADAPAAASLCVSLMAQGDASGVLCLVDGATAPSPRVFSEDEIRLARTVADQVGLAIANLRLRDTLRHQSIRDPLTGLYNRRYLEETLDRELRRAERAGQSLGVLMFDIDLFKQFNDTFGHEAGDVMLREVGRLLRDRFRREDIVCRYGGEEFVIVLPSATLDETINRARELEDAVRWLDVRHRGRSLGAVTLSLGVAVFPDHGQTIESLLRAADAALYRAKQTGRARVEVAAS